MGGIKSGLPKRISQCQKPRQDAVLLLSPLHDDTMFLLWVQDNVWMFSIGSEMFSQDLKVFGGAITSHMSRPSSIEHVFTHELQHARLLARMNTRAQTRTHMRTRAQTCSLACMRSCQTIPAMLMGTSSTLDSSGNILFFFLWEPPAMLRFVCRLNMCRIRRPRACPVLSLPIAPPDTHQKTVNSGGDVKGAPEKN